MNQFKKWIYYHFLIRGGGVARDFDPVAFGKRLQQELERVGLDIKTFQEELAERTDGARGTSYGSVWSYVKGKGPQQSTPRREVVEAMGEILDRLPTHLLYGTGPINRAQREVGAQTEAVVRMGKGQRGQGALARRKDAVLLKAQVLEAMGVAPDGVALPTVDAWPNVNLDFLYIPWWVPALADVRARLNIDAEALGQALRVPLEAVGIDPTEGAHEAHRTLEWLDDYIAGMVPVLLALGPERRRQLAASESEGGSDDG